MLLAGASFTFWPIFMNRSGLGGNMASAVFSIMVLIGVLPFAVMEGTSSLFTARWLMVALAGVFGAIGMLSFTTGIMNQAPAALSSLLLLMFIAQISVASLYQGFTGGGITLTKLAGFATAILTAFLLR